MVIRGTLESPPFNQYLESRLFKVSFLCPKVMGALPQLPQTPPLAMGNSAQSFFVVIFEGAPLQNKNKKNNKQKGSNPRAWVCFPVFQKEAQGGVQPFGGDSPTCNLSFLPKRGRSQSWKLSVAETTGPGETAASLLGRRKLRIRVPLVGKPSPTKVGQRALLEDLALVQLLHFPSR